MRKDFIKGHTPKIKIINALFQCIQKEGVNNVTMRKIAVQAKISLGTLHYYFNKKENIFIECIQELFDQFIKDILKRYHPEDPPEKKLDEFLSEGRDFLIREKKLFVLYIDVWSLSVRNPKMKKIFIAWYKKMVNIMASILNEGIEKGTFNKIDTKELSNFFYFFTDGIGLHWHMQNKRFDINKYFEIIFDHIKKMVIKI